MNFKTLAYYHFFYRLFLLLVKSKSAIINKDRDAFFYLKVLDILQRFFLCCNGFLHIWLISELFFKSIIKNKIITISLNLIFDITYFTDCQFIY